MPATSPELQKRVEQLTVPLEPKLLRADHRVFDAFDRDRKAAFMPGDTPAPLTDTEKLEVGSREWNDFAINPRRARSKLAQACFEFDEQVGDWVIPNPYSETRKTEAVYSADYYYGYRALVEVAVFGIPRLQGCASLVLMHQDGLMTREVPTWDTDRFLDPSYNGTVHDAVVVGTDPDDGSLRIDMASVDAVRFYFNK